MFYRKYGKRLLDIILSIFLLVILSPIILTVAVLVRIKLGSPIIFKQRRPGLNERIFYINKFRTMTEEKDANGDLLPDRLRLTEFGKFLRSTSLDELPELWNILRSDMTIVGPRPLLIRYLPYYNDEERLRHTVRPGLTGLAQINGRNYVEWDKRLGFDVNYVRTVSLLLDLKIIVKTVQKVFKREGFAVIEEDLQPDLDTLRSTRTKDVPKGTSSAPERNEKQ